MNFTLKFPHKMNYFLFLIVLFIAYKTLRKIHFFCLSRSDFKFSIDGNHSFYGFNFSFFSRLEEPILKKGSADF